MTTGALVRTQFLTLKPRDGRDYGGANSAVKSDGSFEFRSVAPGTYYARTVLSTTNWNNLGELEVTVGNGDVEGAVLGIHPIMKIDGTVKAESGDLTRMPFVRLVPLGIPFNGTDPGGQAGADGSFQLDNVGPVQYFVEMHGLPEEMYVKSIRFRDRDVTHSPLDLTRGAGGGLDIVLAAHAASVNGTAEPNAAVAVWSSEDAHTVITDAKGAFHFGSLAPGEYRILAWDDIEPGIAEYAPYRERFNSRATAITLREDSKLTQEVITIPHDQAQAEQERIP
jgi:hypothetical protein